MNLTGELDLSKIVKYPLPEDQYFKQAQTKTQVVLHHSAGWDNSRGMIDGWKADKRRVATAYGVTDDGTILEAFEPQYWAAQIGYFITGFHDNDRAYQLVPGTNTQPHNLAIELRTIGIEICNWGNLTFKDGKFHTWVSSTQHPVTVDPKKVVTYEKPFRGARHFERITDAELESLWRWIRAICKRFVIPTKFDVSNFDLHVDAINGVPGVYTHCNFHAGKSDLPPQPELIEMLKAL